MQQQQQQLSEREQAYKRQKLHSSNEYTAPEATYTPQWSSARQQQQQQSATKQQQQQQAMPKQQPKKKPLTPGQQRKQQQRRRRIQQLLQKLEGQPPFPFLQLPHAIMTAVASKLHREDAWKFAKLLQRAHPAAAAAVRSSIMNWQVFAGMKKASRQLVCLRM
jgi:hypothetical protein